MIRLPKLEHLSNISNNETCQVLFQIASDDSYYNNEAIISQFVALHCKIIIYNFEFYLLNDVVFLLNPMNIHVQCSTMYI